MYFCMEGDCNQEFCHHCFPIKSCNDHEPCKNQTVDLVRKKKILITGCAGFIGSHLTEFFLKNTKNEIYGIDNLNNYYDPKMKKRNLSILRKYPNFMFSNDNLLTTNKISLWKPDIIFHLAASAGVSYSVKNPKLYVQNNIEVFVHILEEMQSNGIKDIIYASSSSVYGFQTDKNKKLSETDHLSTFNSAYAASKYSMEVFASTYNRLYDIRSVGIRFFTVYGPRGRPDMAPYKFLTKIKNGEPIQKYGDGSTQRDYTFIGDIIDGIVRIHDRMDNMNCTVYNLGNSCPVSLNNIISTCETITGKTANIEQHPDQKGDVPYTFADITKAQNDLGYEPKTSLEDGLRKMYESLS